MGQFWANLLANLGPILGQFYNFGPIWGSFEAPYASEGADELCIHIWKTLFLLLLLQWYFWWRFKPTSNSGLQYCAGWVGRGIRHPPSLSIHTHTSHNPNHSILNAYFHTFQLKHYQLTDKPMDWQTDKASYRVASPRL